MADVKDKISALPLTSGVYLMKDGEGTVIYVGKAVSLRKRVQSYFRKTKIFSKTDLLAAAIRDIAHIPTNSEAEALILEASLIKQYQPKYNVELRDDKSYPFIEITGEEFPRISVCRPRVKARGSIYYGPYVEVTLVREALAIIRKIFHFRTCEPFPDKACLDYHIGLCDAPCIQNISRDGYLRNIRRVRLILEGKKDELYRNLKKDMEALVREKRFEEAAKVRDQIRAIGALYSGTGDVNYYKEAEQLQRALGLPRLPERIEAFDISNIMGRQAVGSMVSFLNGSPDKNNYRRFRIKEVGGIDDFQMIAEVVRRRYRRLKAEGLMFPDLIVIDGGKGQLSAACGELEKLEVQIPVVSLAKREEEIFLLGKRNPVILAKDSLGLQLLQRIRDEAHRFAVSYHRLLRGKHALKSD
ncbi:MAG: excinuclease ABC subunit UvrC [Candidatus Omnitrophota bacterium]|nr:excinuclease ABC subunit UvrC [Candidatus Omnitrophota bacterium]MDZ4242168.1 excinuclease ABC subunit UvrC [Candidatus Omnitrophota bacterium]